VYADDVYTCYIDLESIRTDMKGFGECCVDGCLLLGAKSL